MVRLANILRAPQVPTRLRRSRTVCPKLRLSRARSTARGRHRVHVTRSHTHEVHANVEMIHSPLQFQTSKLVEVVCEERKGQCCSTLMADYQLALKLERLGFWGKCLGEEKRQVVAKHLENQTVWEQFLSATSSSSQAELELCMQVRCLLYGEMAAAVPSADFTGMRPDSVYHPLDHQVTDWQRLQDEGSAELAAICQKYGLRSEEAHPSGKPNGEADDADGEKQKPRSRASREIMSLMPDVKPGKKDLLEDRQNELNEALEHVLTELKNMGEASKPFHCKVKKSEAWDYYTVITRPMDLGTMTKKLRAYKYHSKVSFREDIDLIVSNCHEYNEKDSLYVQYVDELQAKAYALLEDVPNTDVLSLKSASGKSLASPVRLPVASEPSSPDSNSEDEAIGKGRPGFGGLGRHQPGKKMRGKGGSIGKRLLKEALGVNGPSLAGAEGEAEPVGVIHTSTDSQAGTSPSGETLREEGPASGGLAKLIRGGDDLVMTSARGEADTCPGEGREGVPNDAAVPSKEPVSNPPLLHPGSIRVGEPAQPDGTNQESSHRGGVAERIADEEDDVTEARWPYGEWFQANLMQRMERLAERAAARHVSFGEQPALVRSPEGMARSVEETRRQGVGESLGGLGGLGGLENLTSEGTCMPELQFVFDSVPDLPVAARPSDGLTMSGSTAVLKRESDLESIQEQGAKRPKLGTHSQPGWTSERTQVVLRQVVARLVAREGFEGLRRGALEVLADLLGAHIRRLGRTLRVLEERYGGCGQEQLIQMCLNGFGVRNVAELAAYVKPKEAPQPSAKPGDNAPKETPPDKTAQAPKTEPQAPILPVRPPSTVPQFPSVPVFKGNLPKVEPPDPEKSSSSSLEPEKKKAKPRAKKVAPNTSTAPARFPGLKPLVTSPTAAPTQTAAAALGLPSPVSSPYQPLVNPITNPSSILYGGIPSPGVLRTPSMAFGVPFGGLSSSQAVRPSGPMGLYTTPSSDAIGQQSPQEQPSQN